MTHALAAKISTTSYVIKDRLANSERGASALEYVGMVLVAAFICGAVYVAFSGGDNDVKTKVKDAVANVLKGPQ